MAKTTNFREKITAKIITAIETGVTPWRQPWNGAEAPQNGITKYQYTEINTVILSLAAMSLDGGKDPRWLTFNQAVGQGWKVKRGSKGTHVLLWKPTIGTDENGKREITAVLQRTFTVFHASQIEGIPEYVPPEVNIIEAHEKAERIIADSGEKRLNRNQRCGRFSADYAFEELVAEMGSLFIASTDGIPQSET